MQRLHVLVAVLGLMASAAAWAQTGGSAQNPHLATAMALVRGLDEAAALEQLALAERWPQNRLADLAQIQLWRGLAYAGLSEEGSARRAFEAALHLEPTLQLPALTSPRVQTWWREALAAQQALAAQHPVQSPVPSRRERPAWLRWVGTTVAVAGVLGLAGATYAKVRADRTHAAAVTEPAVGHALALQATSQQDAALATGAFAGGGAALAVGGVLWGVSLW